MKAWGIPANIPDPGKEPEQAQAAFRFLSAIKGICGFCPHESGNTLIVFDNIEHARAAKWKLEEFCTVPLAIIEGSLTDDNKTFNCYRVLKGDGN